MEKYRPKGKAVYEVIWSHVLEDKDSPYAFKSAFTAYLVMDLGDKGPTHIPRSATNFGRDWIKVWAALKYGSKDAYLGWHEIDVKEHFRLELCDHVMHLFTPPVNLGYCGMRFHQLATELLNKTLIVVLRKVGHEPT